jgi:hypothetical protein
MRLLVVANLDPFCAARERTKCANNIFHYYSSEGILFADKGLGKEPQIFCRREVSVYFRV